MDVEPTPHAPHTAHWMAYLRAIESDRPDALFHDPYSRELAGSHGESTATSIGSVSLIANAIAIRTAMLDRLITDAVARHDIDLVVNLGSGLDTRPWRLKLPTGLQWLDVDSPDLLDHKAGVLLKQSPTCSYQAIGADILDSDQRNAALSTYPYTRRILIVTEGLLAYLHPDQVASLAKDLHRHPGCRWWLTDLVGANALRALRDFLLPDIPALNFQFAPTDSGRFFSPLGWRELTFHSAGEEARRLNRSVHSSALARLGVILATPIFREEFRRLAGVAFLARHESK